MLPDNFNRDEFIAGLRTKHARILPPDIAFSVDDGWLPLISETLAEIEQSVEQHGWIGQAVVKQIKEKLGDLRIYVRPRLASKSFPKPLQAQLFEISDRTYQRSTKTCEICSDNGMWQNIDGYYQTLCPKHTEQRRAWVAGGRKGDVFND